MSYKHILFLSFLLMQTTPVWSMYNSDDQEFNVDNRFSRRRHQSTQDQHVRDPQVQGDSKQNVQSLKKRMLSAPDSAESFIGYSLRLMGENPTTDSLHSIKPEELALFCTDDKLYCKIHNKDKMQITKSDVHNSQGYNSESFDRVLRTLKDVIHVERFNVALQQEEDGSQNLSNFNYHNSFESMEVKDRIALFEFISIHNYTPLVKPNGNSVASTTELPKSFDYNEGKLVDASLKVHNNLAKLQSVDDLEGFLTGMRLNINWDMDEERIKEQIHGKLTQNSPSRRIPYSGLVHYTGSKEYSGYAFYHGAVPVSQFPWQGLIPYHGHVGYSGTVEYSGSVPYAGFVSYDGWEPFSSSLEVRCNLDHHHCNCDKWSTLVLSFREALKEKDYYKSIFKAQKDSLEPSSFTSNL